MTTTKANKTPECSFSVGDRVKLQYSVHPFLIDEELEVDMIQSNKLSGKRREYRIRCISVSRAESGWLNEQNIEKV